MGLEFSGVVKQIFTKSGEKKDGSGTWTSTEIWVEEPDGQFPQSAIFELGKNVACPKEGELLRIKFSMSTNPWEDRVFGKNRAWAIDTVSAPPKTPNGSNEEEDPYAALNTGATPGATGDDKDDLPF